MDVPLDRSLKSFDAFPKVAQTYKARSSRGGLATIVMSLVIALLVWHELKEYLFGEPTYSFSVDHGVSHNLQINVDMTVAMPCHYLSVDVRDAVGDRLHISDEFIKDGTSFEIGQAQRLQTIQEAESFSASRMVRDSRGKSAFTKTAHLVPDGPACRVYGAMLVKRVTGNLHITTLGHGYNSWEHTEHDLMNLSHVIHEFSFGPYFPRISQPLDNSVELTDKHFWVAQYFLSIVATTYRNAARRTLHTNQYSVTDMSRETEHGRGVPGIFFKYDVEPMKLTIEERTTQLHDFLIRLAGIIGGIVVCSGYAWRVSHAAARLIQRTLNEGDASVVSASGGPFGSLSTARKRQTFMQ